MTSLKSEREPVRYYAAKYAIVFANEYYEKLQLLDKTMGNLKWTKNDLMRSRATISMMNIPDKNIKEHVDSPREDLDATHKELMDKVQEHE